MRPSQQVCGLFERWTQEGWEAAWAAMAKKDEQNGRSPKTNIGMKPAHPLHSLLSGNQTDKTDVFCSAFLDTSSGHEIEHAFHECHAGPKNWRKNKLLSSDSRR